MRRALERAEAGKSIYGDKEIIEKFNQVRDLAVDELFRRLKNDAKEIPVFNLVGIIDTIIKNSNLLQDKPTGNVSHTGNVTIIIGEKKD